MDAAPSAADAGLRLTALRELWLHSGTACNLSCPFCHEGSAPADTRLPRPSVRAGTPRDRRGRRARRGALRVHWRRAAHPARHPRHPRVCPATSTLPRADERHGPAASSRAGSRAAARGRPSDRLPRQHRSSGRGAARRRPRLQDVPQGDRGIEAAPSGRLRGGRHASRTARERTSRPSRRDSAPCSAGTICLRICRSAHSPSSGDRTNRCPPSPMAAQRPTHRCPRRARVREWSSPGKPVRDISPARSSTTNRNARSARRSRNPLRFPCRRRIGAARSAAPLAWTTWEPNDRPARLHHRASGLSAARHPLPRHRSADPHAAARHAHGTREPARRRRMGGDRRHRRHRCARLRARCGARGAPATRAW